MCLAVDVAGTAVLGRELDTGATCWAVLVTWANPSNPTRSSQIPRLQKGRTVLTFSVDNVYRVGKGGLFPAPEAGSCVLGVRWEWGQGAPCCLRTVLLSSRETCGFGLFSEVKIFIFPPALFMYYYILFSFPSNCLLLGCFSLLGGYFSILIFGLIMEITRF